jgi:hypothetical protein
VTPQPPIPHRPAPAETDYSANFTNKHSGRPIIVRTPCATSATIALNACTLYGKEYIKKPIPPKYNACLDRPWMNCDSCPPSEVPTPSTGTGLQVWPCCQFPFAASPARACASGCWRPRYSWLGPVWYVSALAILHFNSHSHLLDHVRLPSSLDQECTSCGRQQVHPSSFLGPSAK